MSFESNQQLFLEEARELLETLETSLIQLEEAPQNQALVNDAFRALHTIKGSGAMFGFNEVSEFTHYVENLFDEIRKGLIEIGPEIISIGLRSRDCISSLLEGRDVTQEKQKICEAILALTPKQEPEDLPPLPLEPEDNLPAVPPSPRLNSSPQSKDTAKGVPQIYRIHFTPQKNLLSRGIKVEALFQELQDMGLYHCSVNVEGVGDVETQNPEELNLSWVITLSTQAPLQQIRSVFMFVEDYAEVDIQEVELNTNEEVSSVPRLGEVLVNRGVLEKQEIDNIRHGQKPFGELAVETGLIQPKDLDAALAEQRIMKSTSLERELRQESSSIRVKKEKLDFLVDAVGELVILQARLSQEAKKEGSPLFEGISENLARLTATLRDSTMSIRMVPLEESFNGFQRLVRDLSKQLNKELSLEIHGGSTELDKNIIESLKDPLVHIIRNSADHGIESGDVRIQKGKPRAGTIVITATQMGSNVQIDIRDDGAGLNLDKIKARGVEHKLIDPLETDRNKIMGLIFEPGFSTSEQTTNLSGRGVGMDVVKTNIQKLRGEISVSSEEDKGTKISLSIPLTLVIIDGLLVKVGDVNYVLSLSLVQECVDFNGTQETDERQHHIIQLRGQTIPIIDLPYLLNGVPMKADQKSRLVITTIDGDPAALLVDAVVGKQQVVIKPFTASLRQIPLVSGATILGDGSVALILNPNEIFKISRKDTERQ